MSTTVNVKNISSQTSEKEIRDFFSFWYVSTTNQPCATTDKRL